MKFNDTLTKFVSHDIEVGKIPMLLGEPGIGKSSWFISLARAMRTQIFVLPCNQLADKTDLTGARLVPEGDTYKQVFYPHAVISDAINYAKENPREQPILFLDEINRTTPDVTSALLSIPTLRAVGSVQLPKNLRVVCAGNDKGNVTALDEASITRFVFYKTQPDVATFLSLDDNLNVHIKAVLEEHPEFIFCKPIFEVSDEDADKDIGIDDILTDDDGMQQITTPRTISGLSDWLNSFSDAELLAALSETEMVDGEPISALQSAIEGHVGDTAFARCLLAKLATNLTSAPSQNSANGVTKPKCYDNLKQAPDMTTLAKMVEGLTDKDRSGCLVYALFEPQDNGSIIRALAQITASLTSDDFRTLMDLAAHDSLDQQNVTEFLNSNAPIVNSIRVVLELD